MTVERTLWYCGNLPKDDKAYIHPNTELRRQVEYLEDANLASSLLTNGWQAPAVDIDRRSQLDGQHLEVYVPKADFEPVVRDEGIAALEEFASRVAIRQRGQYVRVGLDLSAPAGLKPSCTPGHYHLYTEHILSQDKYLEILAGLNMLGVVEEGFCWASILRGMSFLRIPQSLGQLVLDFPPS